jgi:hypothetical protein
VSEDPEGDDLPIIDVRSPAERWAESGRNGFDRLHDRVRAIPLDVAALIWMACVLGYTVLSVYTALRGPGFDFGGASGWEKAALISTSGNIQLTFGVMIGLALAFAYTTRRARAAVWMALVGGVWAVIANVVGIAVAFHDQNNINGIFSAGRGTENKIVQAVGAFAFGGLGVVVILLAYSLLASARREPAELS